MVWESILEDLTATNMPKYEIDERGIATIVDEYDGGIFIAAAWCKRVSLTIFALSVLVILTILFSQYFQVADSDYLIGVLHGVGEKVSIIPTVSEVIGKLNSSDNLTDIFRSMHSKIDVLSTFSSILVKLNNSYPFYELTANAKGQLEFYTEVINVVSEKAEDMYYITIVFFNHFFG